MSHKELVKLYNNRIPEGNRLSLLKPQVSTKIHEKLNVNQVNKCAVALSYMLNLEGGSVGSIDLYRLLQAYVLDPEKRKAINEIL